jgi:glycosyltransferase involved in cell wall biosynthesis
MSVRLLELELGRSAEIPPISARYRAVRLLVRLHGAPLGFVEVENLEHDLEPRALRRAVASQLSGRLWAALTAEQWTSPQVSNGNGALPLISVVVCTRDRPRQLDDCLAALTAQHYPRYEVIVVDNAPENDDTRLTVERWHARYLVEQRPGLDWARNAGLAEARGAIVAYTDDDARPDPTWLGALAAGFESSDVHAVTGLVVAAELETEAQVTFEDAYGGMRKGFDLRVHTRRGWRMTYRPNELGTGCNMAFRRETLQRLGGFDRALDTGTATGGGGDLDALQRVLEADLAVEYRPDAVVRHVHRRTRAKLRRQLFDNGRAYSAVLWAALRRARGRERLWVVAAYGSWLYWWHARRLVRRLARRERLPLSLILVELAGAPLGPTVYWFARRRARRLAARGEA